MKITIRHPAGLEIGFEGDVSEFERFSALLGQLPAFVGTLGPPRRTEIDQGDDDGIEVPVGGRTAVAAGDAVIDVHELAERIATLGANTDIERITVMTHAAEAAGLEGLDYGTAERLFDELGQPLPKKIRATFSNAKTRGLVRSMGHGRWKTTIAGQNFARYGKRESRSRRGAANTPRAAQVSLPAGGEND